MSRLRIDDATGPPGRAQTKLHAIDRRFDGGDLAGAGGEQVRAATLHLEQELAMEFAERSLDPLTQLDVVTLTPEVINDTLGSLLKYQDDIVKIQGSEAARLLAEVQAAA